MHPIDPAEEAVFVNLSGVVDELGRVHLLPTLQSRDRPVLRMKPQRSQHRARLLYNENQVLERPVAVSEIHACGARGRMGLEYLAFHVTLPLIAGAHTIQLLRGEEVVLDRKIGERPALTNVVAQIREGRIAVEWESTSASILGFAVFLRFADGRSTPLGVTRELKLSAVVEGFPEAGAATVEVVASDGLLNASSQSKQLTIEPSAPLGIVISPRNDSVSPPGQPLSLIANCYDAFARRVEWKKHQLFWRVDGEFFSDRSGNDVLPGPDPGVHTIELVSRRWGVVDAVTIRVEKRSAAHERHEQLLASVSKVRQAQGHDA